MIKKYGIYDKYKNGFKRDNPPNQIVIHGTGGGASAQSLFDWILGNKFERADAYRGGEGFPYLIDRNGDIYELSDPAKIWQYHSGTGGHDKWTIGIELVNPSGGNLAEYTAQQYGELCKLIVRLLSEFPINMIVGHGALQKRITGKYKVCPGPGFEWDILANELTSQGYSFDVSTECILNIKKGD